MNKSGEIQISVLHKIEEGSSKSKEAKEARGRSTHYFVVIRFSGMYMPHKIEDIPTVVFGRPRDQYARTLTSDGITMFMDTTMAPLMLVTAGKSLEDKAVYVWYPFSQPAHPYDIYLNVNFVGEKIVHYAQRVNPNYPIAAPEYIPGFLKAQQEVYEAEQRAVWDYRTVR